jgi:hypothetical protein|tara:strand:+ start:207 stop:377 length:171 start_codon:yes stop_codon:yes gene_type:complete
VGAGTVEFIDNLTIKGVGTNFTKVFKSRDSIKFSTAKAAKGSKPSAKGSSQADVAE